MNRKVFGALAAASLFALTGAASAQEMARLSDADMDSVTAGALSAAALLLSATATGSTLAVAATAGTAAILQSPVVVPTPLGPVTLQAGAVATLATAVSSN